MKITQPPHYLQPNPTIRQNAHINSELIKNNIQQINHNRVNSLSPPTLTNLNGVNFRPIEMVNNPIVHGAHVLQSNPTQHVHNSSNMHGGRNVPPPGPSHVMKMEQVNRSNSSSRLISQGSRIQYISVAGNSTKDLNLNQGSVNKQISPQPSPYFVQNPQMMRPVMTNMNTMVQRPPSNASVQSSQSRNSKSISNAQIHSNQIHTIQHLKFPQSVGFHQMHPSANPHPVQIASNMHNMNVQNQNSRISPPANNMRTSEVKILYQRGSFSPNEPNSQNEVQIQKPLVQRFNNINNQQILAVNKNKQAYERQGQLLREQLKQSKSAESSQHKLQNKNKIQNKNIRQIVKQIKSTAVESIIVGENRLSNIQSNSKSSLSSHQLQSLSVVTSNMSNQQKLPIKATNSNQSNMKNNHISTNTNANMANKVSISSINHKIAALKEQNRPSIEVIPEVSSNESIYSKNQTKQNINQPSLHPIIQEQKPVAIHEPKQEVYKKVYKSYEQYLEQTKKPQKIIKQFQQSESKTHLHIQYRKAPTINANIRKEDRKQVQSQVYKSVSIPDVYGNADIAQDFSADPSTNNIIRTETNMNINRNGNVNANTRNVYQHGYNQINAYSNNNHQGINSYNANMIQNSLGQKQKQAPENNLQLQNISTINQQSQEYDNDGSYNASSMIGSTLQDNLRGINNSQNKDLSDYEFDSWVKNKYQNVFTKNNNNIDLNMLSNLTNNNQKLQSINPFEKINQVKVTERQKKQNNSLINNQVSGYTQHKQVNIDRGHTNYINNDANYKDTYEKYNDNAKAFSISQSKSPDNKESYYNYHIQANDNKNQISYNNMSTKDKLISQKILGQGATSRITPMKINYNNMSTQRERHSQKQIRQQKYVQNEEQNDPSEEMSFDIYELIDDIYNRQLQNGINRIRQAFGKAVRANHSQY